MKKILTLTLSLFMAFTLCLTVSADGDKGNEGDGTSTDTTYVAMAKVNGEEKNYETLQKAIEAEDVTEVTLFANTKEDIVVASGKNIKLTIQKGVILTNNSSHTITNSGTLTIEGEGTVDNVTNGKAAIYNNYGATVFLQGSVKYTRSQEAGNDKDNSGGNSHYYIDNHGDMTIKDDTTVTSNGHFSSLIRNSNDDNNRAETATLTIESGNLSGGLNTIKNSDYGKLYIKGGVLSNTTQATILNYAYAEISGGTLTPTENAKDAIWVGYWKAPTFEGAGTLKITGGSINGNISLYKNDVYASYLDNSKVSISIFGGTFSSDVSAYLATDYNIAKVNDVYKVTKNGETLPVETITPAVAEGTTETIKTSKEIKGKDSTGADATVTVNDNTQIVLASESKTLDETEVKQVEAVKKQVETIITDASKQELKYIPLNITLTAINNGTSTEITDLGKDQSDNDVEIKVTLYLNDANAKALKGKTVKVIRIHKNTDGGSEIAVLDANLTGNALTFTTGKFSTYVIAYAETKPTPTTTPETTEPKQESIKSYDAKDKNHDGVISCAEEMNSANWTWSETKKACVYRVANTSAK